MIPDGERFLMVGLDLAMCLFALLYAFPHVPGRILPPEEEDGGEEEEDVWYSVSTHRGLKLATLSLLQHSAVLRQSLKEAGAGADDLLLQDVCDPVALDNRLQLDLYHARAGGSTTLFPPAASEDVPIVCQQMFHSICAVYDALINPNYDMTGLPITREWLGLVFQHHCLLQRGGRFKNQHPDLIQFCATLTTEWLQPFFASRPLFFHPLDLPDVCRIAPGGP